MGAWIETPDQRRDRGTAGSLPSWERGLKRLLKGIKFSLFAVAPFVGAWIETLLTSLLCIGYRVAPFVGAWIETVNG